MSILLINLAAASERTDALISFDSMAAIDQIHQDRLDLADNKMELSKIEKNIKRTRKGQNVYIEVKRIGGTLLIIGIIIGSYKAYFPPGFRAMLGAYVTVDGLSHGLVKLNDKDIKKIIEDITKLNAIVKAHEKQLEKKLKYYCQIEPNHSACYAY